MASETSWNIVPTSSVMSLRYHRAAAVSCEHRNVPTALFASLDSPQPTYLPELWNAFTHPEGNVYFTRYSCPKIVTEAYLYDPDVLKQIMIVVEIIEDMLVRFPKAITDATEVYLELEDDNICSYYLIDHTLRVQYWLEEVNTVDVFTNPPASEEHLRLACEELYWRHVDHFPCHASVGLELKMPQLLDILIAGRADHLTSYSSTFPYGIEDCTHFIDTLKTYNEECEPSIYSTWTIARLWTTILENRFLAHYGTKAARLATSQSVLDLDVPSRTWLFNICDFLSFGTAATYLNVLDDQWVDQIGYEYRWKPVLANCFRDWMLSLALAFAILVANLLLLSSPIRVSMAVAVPALLLCNAAMGFGAVLLMKLVFSPDQYGVNPADRLADFHSSRSGFQLTAIIFSLPRVLTLWALIVSSLHAVVVAIGLPLAAICIGGVIVLCILASLAISAVRWVSTFDFQEHYCKLRGWFGHKKNEDSTV